MVRADVPISAAAEHRLRALAAALTGLVTVGAALPDASARSVPLPVDPTAGHCLAAAIRALPSSAAALAWFDDAAGDGRTAAELWQRIGAADAAVIAAPVTDAVKQVRGGRIRRGVARDGLCVPTVPVVARTPVARSRLLGALDAGHDPIAALAVAGLVVRVVLREAPTSVLRSNAGRP